MINPANPDTTLPRAFVVGWPISHSKSPLIHGHWLKIYGITGQYEKRAVSPEDLPRFITTLADQGFVGGNVTIPHKEAILPFVDVCHQTAARLGAANTVWLEDGQLHADNTDGYGFLANLDQHQPGWDDNGEDKSALILGAGGACRPIIDGLIARGFETITLVNRTRERAEVVASLFKNLGLGGIISVKEWDDRSALCRGQSLLVNTTSLGMDKQPPLTIALDDLPETALVTDIVYAPLMTDLLSRARERGNPVVDGLGMLLHQAVPGFEKWFGKRPEVTEDLRALALS